MRIGQQISSTYATDLHPIENRSRSQPRRRPAPQEKRKCIRAREQQGFHLHRTKDGGDTGTNRGSRRRGWLGRNQPYARVGPLDANVAFWRQLLLVARSPSAAVTITLAV